MRSKSILILTMVALLANTVYAVEEREGFSETFVFTDAGTYPMLTVPSGKTFVLLQINTDRNYFSIKADSSIVIIGSTIMSSPTHLSHNYPDRCVVFEQGQILEIETSDYLPIQIVGYFYNCNCPSIPVADLNKDCKVNFADLAVMASTWLTDNSVLL